MGPVFPGVAAFKDTTLDVLLRAGSVRSLRIKFSQASYLHSLNVLTQQYQPLVERFLNLLLGEFIEHSVLFRVWVDGTRRSRSDEWWDETRESRETAKNRGAEFGGKVANLHSGAKGCREDK